MAKNSDINTAKKAAILKELESVKDLLNEDEVLEVLNGGSAQTASDGNDNSNDNGIEFEASDIQNELKGDAEFQIPLLDPSKSTTHELDFPNPKEPEPPSPASVKSQAISEADIPMVDDISASSSLFDDEEASDYQQTQSKVTEKELKDHAQLIVQDLINDAITELEEKLDVLIPNLEERLKKRLEKAMDEYIAQTLHK